MSTMAPIVMTIEMGRIPKMKYRPSGVNGMIHPIATAHAVVAASAMLGEL